MLSRCKIGAIHFYISDVNRTEAWYKDVLGLDIQRMGDDGTGNDWLMISIEKNVELIFFKGDVRPGNSPIIVFDLEKGGIDDIVSGLAAKGATIVTPVSHAPGGWAAEIEDPDGYLISMYQSDKAPRQLSS